jgi:CspA family cold shock protein
VKDISMATGTVKWFDPHKGYGFMQPSAAAQAELTTLVDGQKVSYDVVTTGRGRTAGNLAG